MIEIVGASTWCKPCERAKEEISKVAYQMGLNITYRDLGNKNEFYTQIGMLKDKGYIFDDSTKGIPKFFKNKKEIAGPNNYSLISIREWLEAVA